MPTRRPESYYDVLTAAIAEMEEHGFDSVERVAYWQNRLREAAERSLTPPPVMQQMLREAMASTYRRLIDQGSILQYHSGIDRFTLQRVRPQLRAELDRRILASADLIRLNRRQAIDKTLQRFSGWATSIPSGGSDLGSRRKIKDDVRKSLVGLPFEERRVLIDQGHKLIASLDDILATDGGAIAAEWDSNWRQANYNYREDHKLRDGNVYLIEGSWAHKQGLVKPGKYGYTKAITQPAEEPFCRCRFKFVYALSKLPPDMLTKKGAERLRAAKKELAR